MKKIFFFKFKEIIKLFFQFFVIILEYFFGQFIFIKRYFIIYLKIKKFIQINEN